MNSSTHADQEKKQFSSGASLERPLQAKELRDNLGTTLTRLAVEHGGISGTMGNAPVFMKFLNGRIGVLQPFDCVERGVSNLRLIHRCSVRDLRQYWGTVGAAIAFGIGFVVPVKTSVGTVEIILRRAPGDSHTADGFANSIFSGAVKEAEAKQNNADIIRLEKKMDSLRAHLNQRLDEMTSHFSNKY